MENLLCARHGGLSPDVLGLMSAQHMCQACLDGHSLSTWWNRADLIKWWNSTNSYWAPTVFKIPYQVQKGHGKLDRLFLLSRTSCFTMIMLLHLGISRLQKLSYSLSWSFASPLIIPTSDQTSMPLHMLLSLPGATLPILIHPTHALLYLSNSCSSFKTQLWDFLWEVLPQHCRWSAAIFIFPETSYPRTRLFLSLDWELLEVKDLCLIHLGILHDYHIAWNWVIAQLMPVEWRNHFMNYWMDCWMDGEIEREDKHS